MTYEPKMVKPQVLYRNLLRDGTVAYKTAAGATATPVAGFEPANAYDWRDFTTFRCEAGGWVEVTLASAQLATSFAAWLVAGAAGTLRVEGWNGTSWATAAAVSVGAAAGIVWDTNSTTAAFDKWRVRWLPTDGTSSRDFRQLTIGVALTFPIGQWAGIAPPTLLSGVQIDTAIAVNGSFLGRNTRRGEKKGELSLDLLSESFVRTEWEAFAQHAKKRAFWYRWNPVGYPADVAFAVAEKIEAPTNSKPPPLMKATMPLLILTD